MITQRYPPPFSISETPSFQPCHRRQSNFILCHYLTNHIFITIIPWLTTKQFPNPHNMLEFQKIFFQCIHCSNHLVNGFVVHSSMCAQNQQFFICLDMWKYMIKIIYTVKMFHMGVDTIVFLSDQKHSMVSSSLEITCSWLDKKYTISHIRL